MQSWTGTEHTGLGATDTSKINGEGISGVITTFKQGEEGSSMPGVNGTVPFMIRGVEFTFPAPKLIAVIDQGSFYSQPLCTDVPLHP